MIMPTYSPEEVYVVHPDVRLRNDKKYVIAAYFERDGGVSGVLRLAPVDATVITLFDGIRTCRAAADICTAFFPDFSPDPLAQAHTLVERVLSFYSEPRSQATMPLLIRRSDLTSEQAQRVRQYEPTDFIIRPTACRLHERKLSFPVSLLWLLTNSCQVNCQYCYMHRPSAVQENLLPWDRVEELVREAHRGGTMQIKLSGGDPMCYPYLFKFLDLLDELDFPPIVIPTKSHVSPETARRLARYRVLRGIQFSIDSTVPEIADFIVQSPGFCRRIMESIPAVQAAGVEVSAKSVITPYTLPTIPRLYRDLRGMGVDRVILATYCKSGYRHKDKLYNHCDDYEWLDAQIDRLKEEFPEDEIYYQNGPPKPEGPSVEERSSRWSSRSRCTAGREHFTICANGKVVACEQMPETEENFLGDLRTQSIREVWDGEAMDRYLLHPPRDRFAGTACYDCEEFADCQQVAGPCVRDSCIHFGTRWGPVSHCPKAEASRTT